MGGGGENEHQPSMMVHTYDPSTQKVARKGGRWEKEKARVGYVRPCPKTRTAATKTKARPQEVSFNNDLKSPL